MVSCMHDGSFQHLVNYEMSLKVDSECPSMLFRFFGVVASAVLFVEFRFTAMVLHLGAHIFLLYMVHHTPHPCKRCDESGSMTTGAVAG